MSKELNIEKLVYESKRVTTLLELERLIKDPSQEMVCRFFPNRPSFAGKEIEFQISRRLRVAVMKELEKNIDEERVKLQTMIDNGDITRHKVQYTEPEIGG